MNIKHFITLLDIEKNDLKNLISRAIELKNMVKKILCIHLYKIKH